MKSKCCCFFLLNILIFFIYFIEDEEEENKNRYQGNIWLFEHLTNKKEVNINKKIDYSKLSYFILNIKFFKEFLKV